MARYIDADALYKETQKKIAEANSYRMAVVDSEFLDLINDAETEDVVPKSEVERLQEKTNRYKRYYFRHDYDEMIAEVLDKLDRFINANCIEIKDERGIKGYVTSGVHFAIAELKKKYTEGGE